jgi:hypothetical protein
MKNVLVPVELHSSIDSVFMTALLFARRFNSYIEGMPLGPDLPDLVAFDMPVSWTAADQNTWREMAEESPRRFTDFMEAEKVPAHDTFRLSAKAKALLAAGIFTVFVLMFSNPFRVLMQKFHLTRMLSSQI